MALRRGLRVESSPSDSQEEASYNLLGTSYNSLVTTSLDVSSSELKLNTKY